MWNCEGDQKVIIFMVPFFVCRWFVRRV